MSHLIRMGGKMVGFGGQSVSLGWPIYETYDNPDGPELGPYMHWNKADRLFPHPYQHDISAQGVRQRADVAGSFEALSIPVPNFDSPRTITKVKVRSLTRLLGLGAPDYVTDVGATHRTVLRDGDTQYRAYAAGVGINNIFLAPGHTYHLALFRVDAGTVLGGQILLDLDLQ